MILPETLKNSRAYLNFRKNLSNGKALHKNLEIKKKNKKKQEKEKIEKYRASKSLPHGRPGSAMHAVEPRRRRPPPQSLIVSLLARGTTLSMLVPIIKTREKKTVGYVFRLLPARL